MPVPTVHLRAMTLNRTKPYNERIEVNIAEDPAALCQEEPPCRTQHVPVGTVGMTPGASGRYVNG